MDEAFGTLFSNIEDKRKDRHDVALLSPAGDRKMLELFAKTIKKQDFQDFDILFIYPKGSDFYRDSGLSIINAEEKLPLGTSGCFFAGQAFLYSLGYEVIVMADLDAVPSSEDMLGKLVREAKEKKCACIPLSAPPDRSISGDYYVINQYGTLQRSVFEKCGFATPYFWRGAEDWELMERLKSQGLVEVMHDLRVIHPFLGSSVYHKLANPGKFYPYLSSLMKAYLFRSGVKNTVKYIGWYSFYSFFSNAFSDAGLKYALDSSARFELPKPVSANPSLSIRKAKEKAEFSSGYLSRIILGVSALFSLIISGEAAVGTDVVSLEPKMRGRVFLNSLIASLIWPIYPFQALLNVLSWRRERSKVLYPVYAKDAAKAARIYAAYLKNGKL